MKKLLVIISLTLLTTGVAFGWSTPLQTSLSSGEQTADANTYDGEAAISALLIITDGTNAAKAIVYDNTAAAGTVLTEITVKGADNYGGRIWQFPVKCSTGIYVDISGTGASYIVEYIPR